MVKSTKSFYRFFRCIKSYRIVLFLIKGGMSLGFSVGTEAEEGKLAE